MSVCSKHKKEDPECAICLANVEFVEPDCGLTTCSICNFVYYAHCDTCPACHTENL